MTTILEKLQEKLGKDRVIADKNISPYFTLRTVTRAEYYFQAESREDLIAAVKVAHQLELPLFIFGGGSNIAVTHEVINGLIVRNLYQKKEVLKEDTQTVKMRVSSGYSITRLVKETADSGYSGFEYQLGLPGTVGGAICMNSNWSRPMSFVTDSLISCDLISREGELKTVDKDYFQFKYDFSILQRTKEIVLDAVFQLTKADPEELNKKARESLTYRQQTQPYGVATCGCFFRNITAEDQKRIGSPTASAGYLIDKCGLKNKTLGNFIISDKHANFIINKGNGNPEDLKRLIQLIKKTVKDKFGVELEAEAVIV